MGKARRIPSAGKLAAVAARAKKLEKLVGVIERGKYMWETTFDAITSPVQIVAGDYTISRANISLARVCGKDIRKIIGRKCFEVFAGRSAPCKGCPMPRVGTHCERVTSDLGNLICGREFEAVAYPMKMDADLRLTIIHYRDVTEEHRLQREVIQQEKMAAIGMLAGGVAHEINNPLGGILAFVQLMKKDVRTDKAFMGDLEEIERAAVRCKKIVADLLDFSRVSQEGERGPLDINVLIEKVFPFIQGELKSMNVELLFRGEPDLPVALGVGSRLQQVFLNLMTNACHAMQKGGTLTVETRFAKTQNMIEVRVRDTGAGIPKDVRDKIFDPFFTTKPTGKGTGLGLSISYRIVKDHGGDISFSDVKGGGTEFVVKLPVQG